VKCWGMKTVLFEKWLRDVHLKGDEDHGEREMVERCTSSRE